MNNGAAEQIIDHLNKANHVLIALPQNPNGDAVGAGLAMFDFLKKLDKQADVVCGSSDLSTFNFLPGIKEIVSELVVSQSFVISLKTEATSLDELSYEAKDNRVDIFLKPKAGGKFTADDVSFRRARFPYDLIVTLDTPSLEHLECL